MYVLVSGDFGSLQMPFLDGKSPVPREEGTLQGVAWVALPLVLMLALISALLYANQRKHWVPLLCYRTPTKVGWGCRHQSVL